MPFHRLRINLIRLLCPAKPATKDSRNLTLDLTCDVTSDIQIKFHNIFGKFMFGAIKCRFWIKNYPAFSYGDDSEACIFLDQCTKLTVTISLFSTFYHYSRGAAQNIIIVLQKNTENIESASMLKTLQKPYMLSCSPLCTFNDENGSAIFTDLT